MYELIERVRPEGRIKIRIIVDEDGTKWWVAKDVAEDIGVSWTGSLTVIHVPEIWKGVRSVLTPRGAQEMVVLSLSGLCFFLNRSDKPAALPFQMWVNDVVLPSIVNTGSYDLSIPRTYEEAMLEAIHQHKLLKAMQGERDEANKQIAHDKPLVALGNDLSYSKKGVDLKDLIKSMAIYPPPGYKSGKGVVWSQNKVLGPYQIYDLLRTEEILMKEEKHKNRPMQRHLNLNPPRFQVVTRLRQDKDGGPDIPYFVTLVNDIAWLHKYLKDMGCETRDDRAARLAAEKEWTARANAAREETAGMPFEMAGENGSLSLVYGPL